jgi:IclR family pca regulon transcriptional regulator
MAARAQPVLDELSEEVGEHVAMGTLDGDDVITLAASTSPQSRFLSIAVQVGQRLPADATSLGRILLAYRPDADDADSEAIRAAGYVISDGLLESGLRSLGVPVRDRNGDVVASIAIGVNASRISLDELRTRCLPAMLQAADNLSNRL